jgi:hypothetical protein
MRRAFALAVACVPLLALAGAGAAPAKGKKPVASASVSASESAVASVSAAPSVVVAPAPSGSPVSPLTPRPDEAPPVKASAKPAASYDELMAEIATLRARVSMVGNAVWKSRMKVTFRMRGSHARIAWAHLSLDGARVWSSPKGFAAEDDTAIFEGGVAPGPHALTLEIERRDDRDETYKSIVKTTVTVSVPNGKTLDLESRLDDDSSMGGDFPSGESGKYDLSLKIKAKASK